MNSLADLLADKAAPLLNLVLISCVVLILQEFTQTRSFGSVVIIEQLPDWGMFRHLDKRVGLRTVTLIGRLAMNKNRFFRHKNLNGQFSRLKNLWTIKTAGVSAVVLTSLFLTSCGSSLPNMHKLTGNIFKKKEVILAGKRESIIKSRAELVPTSGLSKMAIAVPSPVNNANWAQPGGNADNTPGHLAFTGQLRSSWTSNAGQGSSSEGQLTPSPIVYNGRIYTLDTHGVVTSFSASSGSVGWRVGLTPPTEEKREGYGGGLAADGGRIFAATGFGTVVAIDPKGGKPIWTKVLGVPIRTSPTAAKGKVFVVTTEGRLYCLSASDGSELWTQRGLPDRTSILSNISPAVTGKTVVVPYSSGEITAYNMDNGRPLWRDSLASSKQGSSLRSIANPGRPAINNNVVFAAGNSGRMIATSIKNGERLWSKSIASTQMPWPVGNMVYIVDRSARVAAMSSKTGDVVWVTQLAKGQNWLGPVMAGNRLWLASSKGALAGLNPKTGKIVSKRDLGVRLNIAPIVASGHMYILTDNAKLVALN